MDVQPGPQHHLIIIPIASPDRWPQEPAHAEHLIRFASRSRRRRCLTRQIGGSRALLELSRSWSGPGKVGDNDGMVAAGCDAFVVKVLDMPDSPMAGEPDRVEPAPGAG